MSVNSLCDTDPDLPIFVIYIRYIYIYIGCMRVWNVDIRVVKIVEIE